jgi:hypothetical protein
MARNADFWDSIQTLWVNIYESEAQDSLFFSFVCFGLLCSVLGEAVLGLLRALCLLGKCSTSEPYPPPPIFRKGFTLSTSDHNPIYTSHVAVITDMHYHTRPYRRLWWMLNFEHHSSNHMSPSQYNKHTSIHLLVVQK